MFKLPHVWRFGPRTARKICAKFLAKKCVHQPLFLALVRHMASADERAPLATLATANEPSVEVRERVGRVA